jgi:hypothetical protein
MTSVRKVIKLRDAMFWTDDSDILYCKLSNTKTDFQLDYKTAKLYIEAVISICNGKPMPFLIDLRDSVGTFTVPAAKLIAKNKTLAQIKLSEAFVANTFSMRLLIASYKRLYDPNTPFGVFSHLEQAIEHCNHYNKTFNGSI